MNPSWTAAQVITQCFSRQCWMPSWEAHRLKCVIFNHVKGLKLVGLGEMTDVCIQELPVSYVKTQRIIAEVWKNLWPKVRHTVSTVGAVKPLETLKLWADTKYSYNNFYFSTTQSLKAVSNPNQHHQRQNDQSFMHLFIYQPQTSLIWIDLVQYLDSNYKYYSRVATINDLIGSLSMT